MKTMGDVVAVPVDEENSSGTDQNPAGKEFGQRTLRSLKRGLGRLWSRRRGNAAITECDPSYKVAYLGNVPTGWAKGEGCVEKPVAQLWRTYVGSNRPDVSMRLTVTNGGLTSTSKEYGHTEYWAHRVTYCTAPASHPRLFVWVYRSEGRKFKPELRCHAALCNKESTARRLASTLNARLQQALLEFRRDKVSRQNARLSLANALYDNPSLPRRKLLLSTGGQNYRPPLERSKSAPKLSAIEEDAVAEEIEQQRLLEELRSLEKVARCWHDQDSWRLARLLDSLNRESSDENGSISSGCETASTATSEERAPGPEDNHAQGESGQETSRRYFSDEVLPVGQGARRNSDGSPNFLTCAGSPRFHRLNVLAGRKRFSSRSEEDESMEEEEEEMEETRPNLFDFEDTTVFDEVVDYRPRGEILRRIETPQDRKRRLIEKYPMTMDGELLETDETTFLTLDSLDEEADSDESGYVEAPPKSLLGQDDRKDEIDGDGLAKEEAEPVDVLRGSESIVSKEQLSDENPKDKEELLPEADGNQRFKERERGDVIKCPISETIKKLANASLRSSKSLDMSSNSCLKALNALKTSKSFEGTKVEIEGESPSLHQRKQLLAQHGVIV